jgi:hypothetical protein
MKRQGDILIRKIKELPKTAKKVTGLTVAYGEVTGHHHTFNKGQRYLSDDKQIVVLDEEAVLVHQEHEVINFSKGVYLVEQQREYDVVKGIRKVMD